MAGVETNWFEDDVALREAAARLLGKRYAAAEPYLREMGRLAAGPLDTLAREADANPPVLVPYDREGTRIDEIRHHPSYREMERIAYGFGLVGLKRDERFLASFGPYRAVLKFSLGYLFSQAEAGLYCPVCLTDGTLFVLDRHDPELARRFGPRLAAMDRDGLQQGAMFLTEIQGGSDVGATLTAARREADGTWRLTGEKWFCSNASAELALVLARPEGAPPGTRGLALFLVPRTRPDGTRNSLVVRRLKDKLGTRSMATAEIGFEGALGYLVGRADKGFAYMTDMLNLSRLYNAAASAACLRRAYREATLRARTREAFGERIDRYPLVRRTLVRMAVEAEANLLAVLDAAAATDAAEFEKDERADLVARLLTPVVKAYTAECAIRAASQALEILGGNGYVEEWVTPRLFRDAQVLPIWEGTANILSLDLLRAIFRERAWPPFLSHLAARAGERTKGLVDRLAAAGDSVLSASEAERALLCRSLLERAARTHQAVLLEDRARAAGEREARVLEIYLDEWSEERFSPGRLAALSYETVCGEEISRAP
ncbi:MAG: acyl-CoA dehydrogenase family protein [Planctomycetes bacterium]|nr:acyl-CoA dehydrogenase family protein [Planctomycetota bacterium]